MKISIIVMILSCTVLTSNAQDSISIHSDSKSLSLAKQLIQGRWIRIIDTNECLTFKSDSLFERLEARASGSEKYMRVETEGYVYSISFYDSSFAISAGRPFLKNWLGYYYIDAWHNLNGISDHETFAIYSVSDKYLRMEEDGKYVYKRVK